MDCLEKQKRPEKVVSRSIASPDHMSASKAGDKQWWNDGDLRGKCWRASGSEPAVFIRVVGV